VLLFLPPESVTVNKGFSRKITMKQAGGGKGQIPPLKGGQVKIREKMESCGLEEVGWVKKKVVTPRQQEEKSC